MTDHLWWLDVTESQTVILRVRAGSGRGASIMQRSNGVSHCGVWSSENAGMSSERGVRNPSAESPRVPGEG